MNVPDRTQTSLSGRRGSTTGLSDAVNRELTAFADIGRLAFVVAMLLASFDIFLAMRVYGFTFRASQLLLVVPFIYALGQCFTAKRIRVPLGSGALLLWTAFILAFIPNTSFIERNIGYGVWLLLNVLMVAAAVQLFNTKSWLRVLLHWYVASFLVISVAGLLQFVVAVSGLAAPFVTQWLIPGRVPRVNGFSYEPSYYATYLLLGWVFCAWLIEKRTDLLPSRLVYASFAASTIALVISTSRLGWAMMILWVLLLLVRRAVSLKPLRLSLGGWLLTINIGGLVAAGVLLFAANQPEQALRFFAGGTGLFGTPAHSVVGRENTLLDTLHVFLESPLIGKSLGGVGPAVGERHWQDAGVDKPSRTREGMSVFIEVLAASGVIGVIPFLTYIGILLLRPLRAARQCSASYATVLTGLVWALAFELLVLQFNQNILRPYLWFHIAVLSAAYSVLSEQPKDSSIDAR